MVKFNHGQFNEPQNKMDRHECLREIGRKKLKRTGKKWESGQYVMYSRVKLKAKFELNYLQKT